MKLLRMLGCAMAMMLSFGVLADASNVLLEFSSKGPDLYADGTPALKGEWYALVWSADGSFGGVTADCQPAREGDEVVVAVPLATGGEKSHCPYVVFQLTRDEAKPSGVYSLLLLDTRNAEKTSVAAAKEQDGVRRPAEVNGAVETGAYTATGDNKTGARGANVKVVGETAWNQSVVKDAEAVKISAFEVKGNTVEISAKNMAPGVKYNVRMGSAPGQLEDYALEVPQTATDSKFIIQKEQANFFQVVRQPLEK